MSNPVKIADVVVRVSYRGPGNVIRERMVPFEIFKDGHFIARPQLSHSEKRVANLPSELTFEMRQGNAFSCRGPKDGNLDVIRELVHQLKDISSLLE